MSWVLAIFGFILLIILHEAGHFVAAKAVGMRVERFAVGIGPLVGPRFRRGETEYGIAPLPIGGYVKITGMNPHEEMAPEVAHRAYYRQAVWKRIVVIVAGPAANVVVAFLILWVLFWAQVIGLPPTNVVDQQGLRPPASTVLRPGDRIISVDGVRGNAETIQRQIATHGCSGPPTERCIAAKPAQVVVERGRQRLSFGVRPVYRTVGAESRPLVGFSFSRPTVQGPLASAGASVDRMWFITTATLGAMARIFDAEERKKISGVVGTSTVLSKSFDLSTVQAMFILAIISLSLAIVNLFPFLPLDGGHVFWALAEKVRGRPIPFAVMERSMAIGFVLVLALFVIGLTNDIDRLQNGGFPVR